MMRRGDIGRLMLGVLLIAVAAPVAAQVRSAPAQDATEDEDPDQPLPNQPVIEPLARIGSVARSAAGVAGQRQTREQGGIAEPMGRIDSRVQNRVQNRLPNRIDRDYDPQALATSPFADAEDRSRTAGRRR